MKNTEPKTEKPLPPKLAYTLKEAEHATGLGRTLLYAKLSEGVLKKTKVGRRTLIPAESLHALIAGEA